MAKTGYLKVNARTDKEGRCVVQPLDGGSEFYTDPVYLTLTNDIVDLLDKEMSEDKAVSFLMQSGWLAKHEREIRDAANKDLSDENERLKRRVGDYTLQIEQLLAEIKAYRQTIMDNQEKEEKRDVAKNNEIVIDVKTRGMEEAHEQIEALADAYDGFPAQVNIKGARDCVFNIYPSQTKIIGMDSDPEGGDGE